jgi:hypothetical protein
MHGDSSTYSIATSNHVPKVKQKKVKWGSNLNLLTVNRPL